MAGQNGGIKITFLIFLAIMTAFCIAAICVFGWKASKTGECGYEGCKRAYNQWLAIWIMFVLLLIALVIIGWIWLCCDCGFCLGIIFVIVALVYTAFAICMLAIYGGRDVWLHELCFGIIGMILGIAMFIVGIIALCIGMGY